MMDEAPRTLRPGPKGEKAHDYPGPFARIGPRRRFVVAWASLGPKDDDLERENMRACRGVMSSGGMSTVVRVVVVASRHVLVPVLSPGLSRSVVFVAVVVGMSVCT